MTPDDTLTDTNGGHVTIRELHGHLDKLGVRVRRVEIGVAVLIASAASPRLGGPTLSDVTTALIGALPFA